jgi:hypothetical protein
MSYVPLLLAFAVTLPLLGGGVTPVSAHGGSTTDRVRPAADLGAGGTVAGAGTDAQADDASASVPENVTVTRGDEATITVSHSDAADLTVGSDDNGFNLSVGLGGSGTTEVVIDTRQTTAADPAEFVEGGTPTLHSDPLGEPMQPAEYTLDVEIDGVERAVGVLVVEPRGEYAMTGSRAPGAFDPSESAGGEDGDYAVVRIEESGLETAVNASDLTGSAGANGLKLNFTQTDPGPNTQPREYVATGDAEVTVLPNLAKDEIYVVWNTTGIELEDIDARNRYRASFALTAESGFVDAETTLATVTFDLRRQSVSLSPVRDTTQYPWDNDTFVVEGRTTRAPGTELEVRVRSSDPGPFLLIRDATVAFDVSDAGTVTRITLPDAPVTATDPGEDPDDGASAAGVAGSRT